MGTMSIQTTIKGQLKEAMLAKEAVRLGVIKGLLAAFTNELVAKSKKPDGELTDDEVLAVIKKSVKQRRDSIEQFRKGNREDLASSEEAELKVLETYLPQMMGRDEIKKIAEKKITELGTDDKSKMGILIGAILKESKGQADGAVVKSVVEELLS